MITVEAIKTSVTNTFSQDYPNTDDLPSPQTDSPGFKPFLLW